MPTLLIRDNKSGKVKDLELTKRRFTVGKSEFNDLVLQRESVSREHCTIIQKDDAWVLRDLGSRNGTLIDGKPISGDVPLTDGVRFEVGEYELQFRAQRQRTGA